MSWLKVDDQMPEHPKILAAGVLADWTNVKAWAWSSRHLTDGFVPKEVGAQLATFVVADAVRLLGVRVQDPARAAEAVIRALLRKHSGKPGLWEKVKDGYLIHDYHAYNFTKKEVEERRKVRAASGHLGGLARWRNAGKTEASG